MRPLFEKWRPASLAEVAGQSRAMKSLDMIARRGIAGRAYWLQGPSGTGKTTIAKILAGQIAEPEFVLEADAGGLTTSLLRDWEYDMHLAAYGKGGRAYIINEAHGLRRDVVRNLLVLLERLPDHVMVVFTTSQVQQVQRSLFDDRTDGYPLLSRCVLVTLTNEELDSLALRAQQVAVAEGLDAEADFEAFRDVVRRYRGNMRAVLQAIESGEMAEPGYGLTFDVPESEREDICGAIMSNGRYCQSPPLANGRCGHHQNQVIQRSA